MNDYNSLFRQLKHTDIFKTHLHHIYFVIALKPATHGWYDLTCLIVLPNIVGGHRKLKEKKLILFPFKYGDFIPLRMVTIMKWKHFHVFKLNGYSYQNATNYQVISITCPTQFDNCFFFN